MQEKRWILTVCEFGSQEERSFLEDILGVYVEWFGSRLVENGCDHVEVSLQTSYVQTCVAVSIWGIHRRIVVQQQHLPKTNLVKKKPKKFNEMMEDKNG